MNRSAILTKDRGEVDGLFSEQTTKRARMMLARGDEESARRELKKDAQGGDEDIEMYLQYLRDVEEKRNRDLLTFRDDLEEDDLLSAAMDALRLDKDLIPCVICDEGDLVETNSHNGAECNKCGLFLKGSALQVRDALAEGLNAHSLTRCSRRRPFLASDGAGGLNLTCDRCDSNIKIGAGKR